MGMFDEVIIKEGYECPHCEKKLQQRGWQTKDLHCCLDVYREGKPNIYDVEDQDEIIIYSHCDHCGKWVMFDAEIKDKIFNIISKPYKNE